MASIGIPIKLLHEAQGHVVTVELKTGVVYRGVLADSEDNMNIQLRDIKATQRDGQVTELDRIYVRGSHIRYFIVPDMLKNAPMFKNTNVKVRGVGMGRGRATVARAQRGGPKAGNKAVPFRR